MKKWAGKQHQRNIMTSGMRNGGAAEVAWRRKISKQLTIAAAASGKIAAASA